MGKALASMAVIAAAIVSGCASGPPAFPDARDAIILVVDGATPAPGQYAIPESQVYVSGSNWWPGVANSVGSAVLGVSGIALGAAADEIRHRAAIGERQSIIAFRYEKLVSARLRNAGLSGGPTSASPSRVVLIPKAHLMRSGDNAALMCVLEAKYSVGGMAESYVHRTYTYTPPRMRPLHGPGGWTDHDGAEFRATTEVAFRALVDAFAADWQGQLSPAKGRKVEIRRADMKEARAMMMLRENGDHVIVAGGTADSPRMDSIVVIERGALVP